jgi:NADH:ubiquinone oxidoreductase subunit 6 (subunit J)
MAPYLLLPTIIVLVVLGGAGVYLLLPKPWHRAVLPGGVLALLALLTLGVLLSPVSLSPESFLFYVFSAVAIISGCLLIVQRNPARAALAFAPVVVSTCGLFLLQAAPFLMAATIIIYAGAIIVTFLFVLMLAQQEGPSDADARSREPLWSALAGAALLGTLLYILAQTYNPPYLAELDHYLQRVDRAAQAGPPAEDARQLLGEFQKWVDEHTVDVEDASETRAPVLPDNGKQLTASIERALVPFAAEKGDPKAQHDALVAVREAGLQVRHSLGSLWVPEEVRVRGQAERSPMSPYSGPAANEPPGQLRRDAEGRPHLPAENVGYLGRSLFTDYLLAVELGGTLLLVATVGAIAIASRRAESLS